MICGVEDVVTGRLVFKVGRSTGYTEGMIVSNEKGVFFDLQTKEKVAVSYFVPYEESGYSKAVENRRLWELDRRLRRTGSWNGKGYTCGGEEGRRLRGCGVARLRDIYTEFVNDF